jgi:hypothetical protein
MATNDADVESRTDLQNAPLGIDAEGRVHEINPVAQMVVVRDDSLVEHREALDGRDVSEWIDYVAHECGWQDVRYSDESFGEWLAGELEGDA